MATNGYFPDSIMPKDLRKETQLEVDDSPAIYNARDYNRHHREIISIEQVLEASGGVKEKIQEVLSLLDDIQNGSYLSSSSGQIANDGTIQIPSGITYATVPGPLTASATTITISSTADWPKTGLLTKFNSNLTVLSHTDGVAFYDYENQVASISNEEVMSYEVISDTQLSVVRGVVGTAQAVPTGKSCKLICGEAHVTYSWASWSATSAKVSEVYSQMDATLKASIHVRQLGDSTSAALLDSTTVPMRVAYNLQIMKNFQVPRGI